MDTTEDRQYLQELLRHRASHRSIQRMSARHREIMRRVALGERHKDIAQDMGMTVQTVHVIVRSPLFQQELHTMMKEMDAQLYDAMQELRDTQQDAVLAMRDSVQQRELPVLRFHAAKDILNRTGITVPKEYHVTKQQTSYEELLHKVRIKYQHQSTEAQPTVLHLDSSTQYEAEDEDDDAA